MEKQGNDNISRIKEIIHIVILAIICASMIVNWNHINDFFRRILTNSTELVVGDFISIRKVESGGGEQIGNLGIYYYAKEGIRVSRVEFDESGENSSHAEFIEIEALYPINLTGGFIGDDDEVLYLGEKELNLGLKETIRIYTFIDIENSEEFVEEMKKITGRRVIIAKRVAGNEEKEENGIFKAKIGRGDKIIIVDSERRLVLDARYWWLSEPINT